jgi:hypothetical protein
MEKPVREVMGVRLLSHDLRDEPQRHLWVFDGLKTESLILWMRCSLGIKGMFLEFFQLL